MHGYLEYNIDKQQELIPNIITISGVEKLIALDRKLIIH